METVSYILWYNSKSHGKTRYFLASETIEIPCPRGEPHTHAVQKPTWTYEKDEATMMTKDEGVKAMAFAIGSGYKDLTLEPVDGKPDTVPPKEEVLH